jgi:2'-5' RNA ligase
MKYSLALDARSFNLNDLKKLKVNLNQSNIDHKWVMQDSLHIDLLSLEEVDLEAIQKVVTQVEPFTLKLNGVWAYPEQKEARVLWVGVQNARELQNLRFEFLKALPGSEMDNGEEFKPILPVVRFRNYRSVSDLISPFKNSRFESLLVNKVILVEMTSGGAYPTYKILEEFKIEKGPEGPVDYLTP